jgi:hypothetical protein
VITVAFTVSGQRPKYLRRTLESWHRVRGIQNAHLLFCCEPLPGSFQKEEFEEYLTRSFRSAEAIYNPTKLGCSPNTRQAMDQALRCSEFAVLAEEDMVVSTDVLEYFTWADQTFQYDADLAAVCAHAFNCEPTASRREVVVTGWFSQMVWGTWRSLWEGVIEPEWGGIPNNPDAWDAGLRELFSSIGRSCIFPVVSRSQHIGETSTLMQWQLAEHFYKQSLSQCFIPDIAPQDYVVVERPDGLVL